MELLTRDSAATAPVQTDLDDTGTITFKPKPARAVAAVTTSAPTATPAPVATAALPIAATANVVPSASAATVSGSGTSKIRKLPMRVPRAAAPAAEGAGDDLSTLDATLTTTELGSSFASTATLALVVSFLPTPGVQLL